MRRKILILVMVLLFGCEFQMKDSDIERLRIEKQAAASEQTAAMMKDQSEVFERLMISQNQIIKAAVGNRQDILPYILMMVACLSIGIGALVLALFLLKNNGNREPVIYVINNSERPETGAQITYNPCSYEGV